ncbi:hypothetical protein BC941DRAFT_467102 [Chlamydoabsidia padenii]|nr:hypothetical protein BC941DRAFT_467102 [Chlamydoabsidia padenii]
MLFVDSSRQSTSAWVYINIQLHKVLECSFGGVVVQGAVGSILSHLLTLLNVDNVDLAQIFTTLTFAGVNVGMTPPGAPEISNSCVIEEESCAAMNDISNQVLSKHKNLVLPGLKYSLE